MLAKELSLTQNVTNIVNEVSCTRQQHVKITSHLPDIMLGILYMTVLDYFSRKSAEKAKKWISQLELNYIVYIFRPLGLGVAF